MVEVHVAVGDRLDGVGDVVVGVVRALVAVFAEVEVFLKGVDGHEADGRLGVRQRVPREALVLDGLHGLVDLIAVLVERFGELADVPEGEREAVVEPVEGLFASLVGADGCRGLRVPHLVGELVDTVVMGEHGLRGEGADDVGHGGLVVELRVALVDGVESVAPL